MVIIAGIGFAAGAVFDAYQQTSGFTTFCNYDILQTLAWGVGGAAAATSLTITAVSAVGMIGMGLQGVGLGLSGLGLSGSLATQLFMAGTSTAGWSASAAVWLAGGQSFGKLINSVNSSIPILPDRTKPGDKTFGILVAGGQHTTLVSGRNGPASQIPPGTSGYAIVSRTHVEGHASALMTQNSWKEGVLWINNVPCPSCTANLPRMLPVDTSLRIIFPGIYDQTFRGR